MAATDPIVTLDATSVRQAAEQAAGADQWDDHDIVEPLEVLTEALVAEADLHEAGRAAAGARFRDLLTGYIRMQVDAREHPEILGERIEAPIVIVGLPRCGTTLLHGLLSADPRLRAPAFWEALRPSPPPDAATFDTDPRRATVQAMFDDMIARNPSLLASLPYSATLKAECNALTQPTLRSLAFAAYYDMPSYQAWYLSADHRSMYRYHRRALQQLQWRVPTGRWVLKSPPHLLTMGELFAEYPDARLIQNHRDPKAVMSSNCALFMANRVLHTDDADPYVVGAGSLELWGAACDRGEAFRASHPDVDIFDVHFDELMRDPLAMVERIYRWLDVDLVGSARQAMHEWLDDNARDKRPVQHHELAEFGLSAGRVDERFAAYRRNHGLIGGPHGNGSIGDR